MIEENKQVLLGMSGGTNSSVAAMRLLEAGYEMTGVTFHFYELNDSTEYLEDARHLAERLGVRHITYDIHEIFRKQVIEYLAHEYMVGHAPVSCISYNSYLKWPLLPKIVDEMGTFYTATGYYVRKVKVDDTYYIAYAADSDGDRTLFLWGLKQDTLRRILFPMGDITKVEARAFAAERRFQKVAVKGDSLGVRSYPMDYRSLLKMWSVNNCQPQVSIGQSRVSAGWTWLAGIRHRRLVDEKKDFVTWHEGYPFYTVGQRRDLGVHLNCAVFVKGIRPGRNKVILASLQILEEAEMLLKDWSIANRERLLGHADIIMKVRYRKQENHCIVTVTLDNFPHAQLHEPLTATASGRAAVFYKDGLLLGGGVVVEQSLLQSPIELGKIKIICHLQQD